MNAFAKLVDEDLLLASVMLVNNETGVVQPVAEAAALAHQSGVLFHTDAARAPVVTQAHWGTGKCSDLDGDSQS